jgi:hypothetical protein
MGPKANVFRSAVMIPLWLFGNVGSCLCLLSTVHFSPFIVTAITCDRTSREDAWITDSQICWVCCVPEFHQSALSSMATRRNLADEDITELVSESDSDKHTSEDISAHSDGNTDDITDTNCTQWTDNTHCQLTVPVVHTFIGGHSRLQQTEPPHIKTDPSPLRVLFTRQGRQAPSMSQLKRLDYQTQQTLAYSM